MIRRIIDTVIPTSGVYALVHFSLFVALNAISLTVVMAEVESSGPPLIVSATSATLMDSASSDAQVIGRVSQGTRLTATGRKSGDWVEIQAPAEVSGWVFGELVRDGEIATSSVKVRSGPGIGYAALGTLVKGTPIVSRGSRGDWLEIAGQPLFVVWVERAMVAARAATDLTEPTRAISAPVPAVAPVVHVVETPAPASPRPDTPPHAALSEPLTSPPRPLPQVSQLRPAAPPVDSVPSSVRTNRPTGVVANPIPAPALGVSGSRTSPIGRRLIASAPQGAPVVVSGILRPVGFAFFPVADYRLVSAGGDGPAFTLCYVTGSEQMFSRRIGQAVTIEGRKYWSVGSREPIVLVYSMR